MADKRAIQKTPQKTGDRICVGAVVGARGLKGDVRVKSFTGQPGDIAAYGPVETEDGTTLSLKVTGEAKGVMVVRIKGITNRTEADALKGQQLYVERSALPDIDDDDEFYHADLVGLRVVDETDTECGTVIALYNFGGGDMVDIRRPDGRILMLPFSAAAVPSVEVSTGRIVVASQALSDAEASPDSPPKDEGSDS